MSYEVFKTKVSDMVKRAGGGIKVGFSSEDGKHIARCSDGTTIIGNASCKRVQVKWGSGHTAHATI